MSVFSLRAACRQCSIGLSFCLLVTSCLSAQSVFRQRPDDPRAVDARPGTQGLHGDGVADDADALQSAINRVQETTGDGVVFLAEGRYRLSHTVYLWSGIRLIGYGEHRPVLILGDKTPGFDKGHDFLGTGKYMLQFASRRPIAGGTVVDANEFTFYSGLNNIDFKIGNGNPAAIAIRFHVAQHSFLAHSDIQVGQGRAGIEDVGNQAHDISIRGGAYGIVSVRTSPAWQFLLMDAHITGQRLAAIHTEEVGMTLIRVELADTPVAVEISGGRPEQLYGRDLLLRNISKTAVALGDISQQHHQVTLEEIHCVHVKRLLAGGEAASGWTSIAAPSRYFVERKLTLGQEIGNDGREGTIALRHSEKILTSMPGITASDIPELPAVADWFNVKSLNVSGDGVSDDTAALQEAINTHRVLYLPSGVYRLTGTLHLRSDSVLIGLNPATTMLTVKERDPNFMGDGVAVPLLDTPRGGREILSGFAVATGDVAPRVAGIVWRGGPRSLIDDVNFPRGRGGIGAALGPPLPKSPAAFAEAARTVEPFRGSQFPSLWIRDGGGGLIRDVWTANTMARSGWRVEGTQTAGIAYQVSCEHHPKNEVQFVDAAHWSIYALQTEEESPDGTEATAVELERAHDITFANLFDYRVSRNVLPKLAAVVSRSSGPVRLENMHNFSQTRLAFDNSVIDETSGVAVRTHDFTVFEIGSRLKVSSPLPLPTVFRPNGKLEKVAGGFSNASGLTADLQGAVFFTDSANHRVYRWDDMTKQAAVWNQDIDAPQSAMFVAPSTLLVVDNAKRVYALSTGDDTAPAAMLSGEPQADGSTLLLPVGLHDDLGTLERLVAGTGYIYAPRSNMARTGFNDHEPRSFYYAPGTKVAVEGAGAPAPSTIPGPRGAATSIGTWKPDLQAMQFAFFKVGDTHLVASEDDDKVYRVRLATKSHLASSIFAARSGTSVVEDIDGNVYIAGAQVFIYDGSGHPIGVLEVPERPSSLAFAGSDHRTLFIGARSGLYAIRTRAAGRVP